jgi:flavin reductase (DIM6/NTAB) family NADH-FMN oxidoreductase RutF/DNA-binding GntR family transcriptional regulator
VFRDVAGHFATGVTVITTANAGLPAGTTASAVASLSMDPPMMLVCLNRSSATHDQIAASGVFGVNILAQDQGQTASAFARKGTDKFAGIPWSAAPNGVPLIDGSLATIACRVVETTVGGTHTVFLGEVIDAAAFPGEPLTYYRGTFGRFEHDAVERAYKDLRQHVLQRRTPVTAPLDPHILAEQLGSRPEFIRQGIVRLESEGLVIRAADGSAAAAPITAELAKAFFAAQAAIEAGVIDTHLPHAREEQIQELQSARDALTNVIKTEAFTDLAPYVDAARFFHRTLIRLSPSQQLLGAYEELSTAALWSSVLPDGARSEMLDHANLLELADAVVARDSEAARAAVRRHLGVVTAIAAEAITARGGAV